MTKLDAMLPGMYAEMHARGAFQGDAWEHRYFDLFSFLGGDAAGGVHKHTVLDFGCGPTGGLAGKRRHGGVDNPLALYDGVAVPYDPYVPEYAADPWKKPLTAFFSCDVFEHMPLHQIRDLVRRLCKHKTITHVLVSIATRPANKTLPNGLNVHITVKSPEWWQGFFDATLGTHFECTESVAYMATGDVVFGFVRKETASAPPVDGLDLPGRDSLPA